MNKIKNFVGTMKGFIVPNGYTLRISTESGEDIVKQSGEFSGGNYAFSDVASGNVPGWFIEGSGIDETPDPLPLHAEVYDIAKDIKSSGGDVLFVGGVVRDRYLGLENKDVDIEVYNTPSEKLQGILSNYGKVDVVGASFGVIKLTTKNGDYDFSLPRRESKSGEGHRGFIVEPDHTMSAEEAASRRDFTFNAMSITADGHLIDFFNGLKDLKERKIRHVSDKFAEDPLRVLRGMQFAARFDMTMDPSTAKLANELKKEYKTLPKERIWGEWAKWALKGDKPSAGLKVLKQTGWIDFYPQLKALDGVQQDSQWHPEGDVWTHTLHVVDEAARIAKRDGLNEEDRLVLVLAALCHDLGKPSTTEYLDGRWRAPGHEEAGVQPTKDFLRSIGATETLVAKVAPLVGSHMAHLNAETPRAVRRLALRLYPSSVEMLTKVIEADHSGRPPLPKEIPEQAKKLLTMAKTLSLGETKPTPLVGGRHLLELAREGHIPEQYKIGGPHFGVVVDTLFEAQLEGHFEDEASGVLYAKRLLSSEYQNAVVYTSSLSPAIKNKLIEYIKVSGMEMEDLWDMGQEQISQLIETSLP